MQWPTIDDVAEELRLINLNTEAEDEEGIDVRLQVYEDGAWAIRVGDPSYDTDHRGYWGASGVPGVLGGIPGRFNAREVARDLIEQAKDMAADDVHSNPRPTKFEQSMHLTLGYRRDVKKDLLPLFDHAVSLARDSHAHGYYKRAGRELAYARRLATGERYQSR